MSRAFGPRGNGNRPGLRFRGSRRRLRQVRLQGNWSREMWLLVIVVGLTIFVLIPWLIRHQ
jgi:hypothetical protein